MPLKKAWPESTTRLVLVTPISPAIRFLAPRAAANDAIRAELLPPPGRTPGLRGKIERAASWLLAEAIFGFAVCGAAAHPCVLDPAWRPYENDPAEAPTRGGAAARAAS
jgi:hypothetical protein